MSNPYVTTSPNMALPIPLETDPGPDYAANVNASLLAIDGHTHTGAPTDGKQLDLSKQLCTGDVELNGNDLGTARSVELQNNPSNLTGTEDVNCLCVVNNVLGFNNSAGTFVPLTGALATLPTNFSAITVTTNYTIAPNSPYTLIECNAGAPITVTLPVAAAITPSPIGRFFIIKDVSGAAQTNNITIIVTGASGNLFQPENAASRTIATNGGYAAIFTDGVSVWYLWGQTDFTNGEQLVLGGTSALSVGFSANIFLGGTLTVQPAGGNITVQSTGDLIIQAGANFSLDAPMRALTTAVRQSIGAQALNSSGATTVALAAYSCPIIGFTGTLTGNAEIDLPSVPGAIWLLDWSHVVLAGNNLTVKVGSSATKALATTGTAQYVTTPAADSCNFIICTAANTFVVK